MSSTPTCLSCGTDLSPAAHDGLCPACMLRSVLAVAPDEETAPPRFPRSFGTYDLLEEVARGGMGVVYRAQQRSLNRIVALKALLSGAYSSETLLRRFRAEAEAAAGLQHPHIVAIHEFGECDDQPYYTMDFVQGKNLAEICAGRPLDVHRAVRYMIPITGAVQFAHDRGILHRDIKPSNVLIDLDDRPRVTDFGLAKRLGVGGQVTITGQIVGSPSYLPPELVSGREAEADRRSDVYALGALLYHMLTGRPPFAASTIPETLLLVTDTEPVPPRVLNPAVSRDLETVCLKCLEKDPGRRYATAHALGEDLHRLVRGESIVARPVSGAGRAWRWCRRHPALAALLAITVTSLAATTATFYVSARRVHAAHALEQVAHARAEQELYATNMMVVSFSLTTAAGDDPRSNDSKLEELRPGPGQPDLRGFEWRYLWTLKRPDTRVALTGHDHVIARAVVSPDGRLVASLARNGRILVWDADDGRKLHEIRDAAHLGGFLPDSRHLIYNQADLSVWSCDLALRRAERMDLAPAQVLGIDPGGAHLIVAGPEAEPVRLALAAGTRGRALPPLPPHLTAVVGADGTRAAVVRPGPESVIVVTDLSDGRAVARLTDPRPVLALALSADGRRLALAGFEGVIKVWDVDGASLLQEFKAFLDPVFALAYSADGRSLAAGGNNRTVRIWDTDTWTQSESLRGHFSTVTTLAFTRDGRSLVSGAEDESTLVFPTRVARAPTELRRILRGPRWDDRIPSLGFSPDSRHFVGTAADGTIKVWKTATGACVATYPMAARTVAFSADGAWVGGEGYDGLVRRWRFDGTPGEEVVRPDVQFSDWSVEPIAPERRVHTIADRLERFGHCGTCEITGIRDGALTGRMASSAAIAIAPTADTLCLGLPGGEVEVWDIARRQRRLAFRAHKLPVSSIAVSEDGRYIATGSLDNSTRVWLAATGELLFIEMSHNRPVWALAFAPDGAMLASGSCDKAISLISLRLRRTVAHLVLYTGTPEGYEQEVRLLRFSPDGNTLAAALGDGTVRFYRAEPFSVTDAPR